MVSYYYFNKECLSVNLKYSGALPNKRQQTDIYSGACFLFAALLTKINPLHKYGCGGR